MLEWFVVCTKDEELPAFLERFRIYRAPADEAASRAGLLRVANEFDEDYLFPASMFAPIDLPQAVARALRQAG